MEDEIKTKITSEERHEKHMIVEQTESLDNNDKNDDDGKNDDEQEAEGDQDSNNDDEVEDDDEDDSGNEDTILFGSLSSTLADSLADEVEARLVAGVASLPLLSTSDDRADQFRSMMRETYMTNVDIWELYAERNLFTVTMFPKRRRHRIVQAFLQRKQAQQTADNAASTSSSMQDDCKENMTTGDVPNPVTSSSSPSKQPLSPNKTLSSSNNANIDANKNMNNDNDDHADANSSESQDAAKKPTAFKYPLKDELPTDEDMTKLEEEMANLKTKIEEARLRRNRLMADQKSAEMAEEAGASIVASLENVDTKMVDETVKATMESAKDLRNLAEDGKELQMQLDIEKQTRKDDEMEDADNAQMINSLQPYRSKKRLSLEDQFAEDRKMFSSSVDDLVAFSSMLKKHKVV